MLCELSQLVISLGIRSGWVARTRRISWSADQSRRIAFATWLMYPARRQWAAVLVPTGDQFDTDGTST
jgi:hypothetical protein